MPQWAVPGPSFHKDRLRRMRDVARSHVDSGEAPGYVALVERRGEVVVDVVGHVSFGGAPLREDAIFRLSSMTKPVTAVATLLLCEECVIRLDDPVAMYVPELANRRALIDPTGPLDQTVPAHREITVRDLLAFTWGFGADFGDSPIARRARELNVATGPPAPQSTLHEDDYMRRLGTLPLMSQPGDRWLYNTGSDVLGVLLSRVTGSSFASVLHDRVLAPLGMKDTAFSVPPRDVGRLVTSYTRDPLTREFSVYDEPDGQWATPPPFCSGGAGLVGTAADYLSFARMLRAGGAPLLSRSSVAVMTTNQLTDVQRARSGLLPGAFDTLGWGYGVSVVVRQEHPAAPVGQYGWSGGLGTYWCNDPVNDMTIIVMTNASFTSPKVPPILADYRTGVYASLAD
jgi:CubicO group peptidase (beta-lactamase class C family)